ncbi:hypothetical protein HHK36_008927 [Tetracentron sinense]|uniref:Plastid transcriptionally active 6 n=1 Tax=Tetracentron sinense TaxID=13715 RepID=A0A834ZEB5_TETSI|nr:hypothetical protein HHK36_008927 [Tetracentron sinense]
MRALLLLSSSPFPPKLPTITSSLLPQFPALRFPFLKANPQSSLRIERMDFRVRADDGDVDGEGPDEYDMEEEEVEEVDNKMDYDVDYDRLLAAASVSGADDIHIQTVQSKSFVSTQGWDSDMVVDYRINEDEFHKISLLDCDFFIRKPPDPDNDVYDFREMYVTPPDTDIYTIPKVLAPMPQKYIRCSKSDYGCYNVTEPPIDAPRDPMYKSEREIMKVWLKKNCYFIVCA